MAGPEDLALILFRVQGLEDGLRESRSETREALKSIQSSIHELAFVPLTLYLSERDGLRKDLADIHKDVDDARKIALGAFGTIASAIIGAIIIAVVASLR